MTVFAPTLPFHEGIPPQPHDLWSAWRPDLLVLAVIAVATFLYLRGQPKDGRHNRRRNAFLAAMAVLVVALMSPVEAAAGVLLTAHMIQHVLLIAVAAPLLAYAAPGSSITRALSPPTRMMLTEARSHIGLDRATVRRLRHPLARWGLFVFSLWLWHASLFYNAALGSELIHRIEHIIFFGSAVLLWAVIVGPRHMRADRSVGIMLVFLLVLQGVVLSALMTFSSTVWYDAYATQAVGWNLTPLEDQHLAGLIMWFPTGLLYTAIGISLVVQWLRETDGDGEGVDRAVRWTAG